MMLWRERIQEAWERWLAYYQALQPREQWLLHFAAIALPSILAWFGLWLPLQEHHDELVQTLQQRRHDAEEAERLARILQQATREDAGQKETRDGSLLAYIDALLTKYELRDVVTRMTPQSGMDGKQRLRLELRDFPYEKAAQLLIDIERESMHIRQMRMDRQSGGRVDLRLLIEPTK